jgi:GT2 family glycosyltransferase
MEVQESNGALFQGRVLGRAGDFLIGWAMKSSSPDEEISVDLYGDGQWMATTRAGVNLAVSTEGLTLPDEANGHGFVFNLSDCKMQSIARFEARVSNHPCRLEGVVLSHADTAPLSSVVSARIEYVGGLSVRGFVWDALYPGKKLKILAYEDERLLATAVADQKYSGNDASDTGPGDHCFTLNLPLELADGRVHEIRLVTEQGAALEDDSLTLCVPATDPKTWVKGLQLQEPDGNLLEAIMDRYNWFAPVSLDFSGYAEWFQRFGNSRPRSGSSESVLIAISGDGDISATLASLIAQSHRHWRALVCGSAGSETDSRIRMVAPADWLAELRTTLSQDIDIVSFVKAGDALTEHALSTVGEAFCNPDVKLVYSDCDRISADGSLSLPWFKPDWDPDLFLHATPLHHLFASRVANLPLESDLIAELDAWPWLAVAALGDDGEAIHHIPQVLYHRAVDTLPPVHADAQRQCDAKLAPELNRVISEGGSQTLIWQDPETWPKVSIIIPTRDHAELLKKCIESLLNTDYPDMDIIVVDNDTAEVETLKYLEALPARGIGLIGYPGVFNYSAINNKAVLQAKGSLIVLMNNDIEVIDAGWLKAMVRQLARPNVGAVGAKLIWPNEMVQHGGVVLGMHGLAGHTGNDWHKDDSGYFGYNQITRSVGAVTAACLLCRREDYDAVGGLNEKDFPVNFNDVDLCLKLRQRGKRIVWTSNACLIHAESVSRGRDRTPERKGRFARERNRLMQRWQHWIIDDPYYNPNLNLDAYSHAGLAVPPRERLA